MHVLYPTGLIYELPPTQKISAFNRNIMNLIQAQETVSEGDSRLFTKLRNEFLAWDDHIEEYF